MLQIGELYKWSEHEAEDVKSLISMFALRDYFYFVFIDTWCVLRYWGGEGGLVVGQYKEH